MFDYFNLNDTKDYEYLLDTIGADLTLNGELIKGIVTTTELEQNFDDRRISSLQPFKRGDVIAYENKPYMIISEENTKRYNKYKGIMRSLPFSIIFNRNCVYSMIQCYIEVEGFSVRAGQIISTAKGDIQLFTPDNEASYTVSIGSRFIKHRQVFNVTGIDRYSHPGMAIISASKTQYNNAVDDLINEVADGLSCNVVITNQKPILVVKGSTVQLTLSNNKMVIFTSSNPEIATVSTTGLVTGIEEGEVTLTATSTVNESLKDTIKVNIALPDKFTIKAKVDKTSIKYDEATTITSEALNNGKLTPTAATTYSLVHSDLQTPVLDSIATIAKISEREAIVRNTNKGTSLENIKVKVIIDADPNTATYVDLVLNHYIEPAYSIQIFTEHVPANEIAYNDQMFLGKFIFNNEVQEDGHTVTWSLVGSDQLTPVPATIAEVTVEDTANQIYVRSNNETGVDADIYVKATLNGEHVVSGYYAVKAKTKYIAPAMQITRSNGTAMDMSRQTNDKMVYGYSQSYKVTMSPTQQSVTWSIDLNGTSSKMATITAQNGTEGTVTIKAIDFAPYPRTIYLVAKVIADPTQTTRISIYVGNYNS